MGMKQLGMKQQQMRAGARNGGARTASRKQSLRVQAKTGEDHKGKWRALDEDESDDQQDIQRGRGMAAGLFQGEDAGNEGTHNVVLQSADYDAKASRKLEFLDDDYYCSPHFMDKVTLHLVKNYLADILPKIKIPLILGVWGGKGQGKTFQAELIFKKLGMEPVVMSAGELESGNAGEPAKLIRQRYREAADMIKKGQMTALFINDLDAGAGRMGGSTQYTVNNQLVNATLMNIADNPTNVQLPGQYNQEEINRVPIVATGNDFSTLYAPLIRDGRMEKFYWSPTRDDRVGVVMGIFKDDGVGQKEAEVLVDTFQGQTVDFFGALRSRIYDDKIREFVENTGFDVLRKRLVNPSYEERNKTFEKPDMSLQTLLAYGRQLEQEQENVKRVQLADEYLYSSGLAEEESQAQGALLG